MKLLQLVLPKERYTHTVRVIEVSKVKNNKELNKSVLMWT